jgi:DNA transformation protein
MMASPSLLNIGKISAQWLSEIGITTQADLEAFGVVEAWCCLKEMYPERVSLNLLYGLEGALTDTPWNAISAERKAELKAQVARKLKS